MIQIVIQMDDSQPNKPISVQGPLGDKVVCLGMLEMVKQLVLAGPTDAPRVLPAAGFPNVPPGALPGVMKS